MIGVICVINLVSAKCPSCGAELKVSEKDTQVVCEYCRNTILVDDAIATYKLKVSGNVSVQGITTNSDLIEAANELLSMNEYLKAKRKFLEFSERCPEDYQGWLGLLICRTRNFTIKDNNTMFESDINKYYEHFLKVAPDNVKNEYVSIIENYLHPTVDENQNQNENVKSHTPTTITRRGNNTFLWILGWIFFFPIPLTILIWRSNWSNRTKVLLTILLWGLILIFGGTSNSETSSTSVSIIVPFNNVV